MTTLTTTHPTTTDALPLSLGSLAARGVRALLATDADWSATAARVTLGVVMLPRRSSAGSAATASRGRWGSCSVGAAALVAGVAGRAMAAGMAAIMVGAVATVHFAHGFFMNWGGTQAGEGFEYHLLAIGLALVVMLRGSGAASVDRLLVRR